MNPESADPAEELRLARAAAAGDRRAAEDLLGRLYHQVFAICRRICADTDDGEDAAQEAMINIARSLPNFDGRSAVRTWSYRIATNAALDELRRRRRRPQATDVGAMDSPRRVDEAVSERIDIDAAMAALPVEFRAAVVLRDLLGMDYAEIATTLDVPVGTVRSRIARGRGHLRELLGNGNQTDEPPVETVEP